VACALLDRRIHVLAQSFESEGGFTERLYRVRSERRYNPEHPYPPAGKWQKQQGRLTRLCYFPA